MKLTLSLPGRLFVSGLVLLAALISPASVHHPVNTSAQPGLSRISLLLSFEENRGQADQRVRFLARGRDYSLALDSPGAELRLSRRDHPAASLRLNLVGGSARKISGLEPLPGRVSHFTGNDPAKWRTGIATYARVRSEEVWPGIDVVWYGNEQQLEYDFIVAPGADPQTIRLAFEGADRLSTDDAGDLLIEVAGRQVRQHRPFIYQEVNGLKREITGEYQIEENHQVSFVIGDYDRDRPLVIDPVLSYATYFGGASVELGGSIALDSAGNLYLSGTTGSADFPTVGATPGSLKGEADAFVMKLNAAGNTLLYAAYFGGSGADLSTDLATDAAGNLYFCGYTSSTDLPTMNPAQAQMKGEADLFVAKLDSNGGLLYSTYLGGGKPEISTELAVDAAGEVVLTGFTASADFPLRNPFKSTLSAGTCGSTTCPDAFVAKLNAGGNALVYSSYLGGSGLDTGNGLALDSGGNAYLTGMTTAPDFTVKNAQQPALAGGVCGSAPCSDAFITKVDPTGALVFSTYFGGGRGRNGGVKAAAEPEDSAVAERGVLPKLFTDSVAQQFVSPLISSFGKSATSGLVDTEPSDLGLGIALDAQGNIYLTGVTGSIDLPVRNAAQPTHKGGKTDAFVAKFNPTATALVYCTYLGGNDNELFENTILALLGFSHQLIAVDSSGAAYVTGTTVSADFPQKNQLTPGLRADAFVTQLDPAGAIIFSTYYGGSGDDIGQSIVVDSAGAILIQGGSDSADLPTVTPLQSAMRGEIDLFIARIGGESSNAVPVTCVSAANYKGGEIARESIVAAFGTEMATGLALATSLPLPTSLGGTTVKIRDSAGTERAAPLFFVSPGQINYYVPEGTADGAATITVTSGSGKVSTGTVQIRAAVPGLFSANASGQGVAAALAVRVKANGALIYEAVAQWDATQGRFGPLPIDLGPDQGAATDVIVLALFGTGIRYRQSVSVNIGGVAVPVDYAGITPGFIGLDQVNVRLSRSLIGRGEAPVNLIVDGRTANQVTVAVK